MNKNQLIIFLLFISGALMSARDIQYTLFMEAPHTHLIDIQIEINGLDGEYIDLSMPVWTPGS